MKCFLHFLLFYGCGFSCLFAQTSVDNLKEVEYNWKTGDIIWGTQFSYVPCHEAFKLRITNCPDNTVQVNVNLFESTGDKEPDIKMDADFSPKIFIATSKSDERSIYTAIINPLRFKRFYYFRIELITEELENKNSRVKGPFVIENEEETSDSGIKLTQKKEKYITTTTTEVKASSNTKTVTTTTIKTITEKEVKFYTLPMKSELSYTEVWGGVGSAMFSESGNEDVDHNLVLATGIKIRYWPVSTNDNIPRYLYPFMSRLSLVIGATLSDLKYKSSDINAAFIGINPLVAIDVELTQNIGISAGTVFGKQTYSPSFKSSGDFVAGIFLGLSFSTQILTSVKDLPASNLDNNKN